MSTYGNGTDEPAIGGKKPDDHTVFIGIRLDLNIGVTAGGEEAFDAGTYIRHAQRFAAFQRKHREQFVRFEGLGRGEN